MSGPYLGRQNPQRNHVKISHRDRPRTEKGNTPQGWYQMFRHIRAGSAKWKRWASIKAKWTIFWLLFSFFRARQISGFRFRRNELPRSAHPPQGRRRLRDAIKDLRHPTKYYDRFWHPTLWSHRRVFVEFHQGVWTWTTTSGWFPQLPVSF